MTKNPSTTCTVRTRRPGLRRGFSLMEMVVSLAMLTVVLIGALAMLDATNRVTRVQLGRADIQQSVRISQEEMASDVRMAGRGGLLTSHGTLAIPNGVAMKLENNVAASRTLFITDSSSGDVVEGSDILSVRGIFDSPLMYANFLDKSTFQIDVTAQTGWVKIPALTPQSAFSQDFDEIQELLTDSSKQVALILVSPFSDDVYGVAEIDYNNSSYDSGTGELTLAFQFEADASSIDPVNPTSRKIAYSGLSGPGAFPATTLARSGIKTIGVLEEYRYFIRDTTVEELNSGDTAPKLARAHTMPNWDELWDSSETWEDIANYVLDLQVAFGYVNGGQATETTDGSNDQWYFNNDTDTEPAGDLALVRVTSVARSELPERGYTAPSLFRLEDRTYTASDLNALDVRRHQRFFLETTIDVRNL